MTLKNVSLVLWSLLVYVALAQVNAQVKGVDVNGLIEQLSNSDSQIRDAAIVQLSNLGRAVVPALVVAIDDDRRSVRDGAVRALGSMGSSADGAVPALISKLPYPRLPAVAIPGALSRIGLHAVPALIAALDDGHYKVRSGAAASLAGMIEDRWWEKEQSSDLAAISAALQANLDKLEKCLKDSDERVREAACEVIGNLRQGAKSAIPALIDLLGDDEERVAACAHNALVKMGSVARPELIHALRRSDPRVARKAAQILKFKRTQKSEIPALIAVFVVPDDDLRLFVSSLFEGFEEAIPDLLNALDSPDPLIRRGASRALELVPSAEVIPRLAKALSDPDIIVCLNSVEALARNGSVASAAVPNLKAALKSPDPRLRLGAAAALGSIGKPASPVVPELIEALVDPEPSVRGAAGRALGKMEPLSKNAVPQLIDALKDQNMAVKEEAAVALGKLKSLARGAIPAFVALLAQKPDKSGPLFSQSNVANAFSDIVESLPGVMKGLRDDELTQMIDELDKASAQLRGVADVSERTVEAVDRVRTALANERFRRSPIDSVIRSVASAMLVLVSVYCLLLPALILCYPHWSWARSALNSGIFDKMPVFAKIILNSRWSRWRLLQVYAILSDQTLRLNLKSYIPQTVSQSAEDAVALISFDDIAKGLDELFVERRPALLIGRSGTGKSVLMRRIASRACELFARRQYTWVPVLIDLQLHSVEPGGIEGAIRTQLRGGRVELRDSVLKFMIAKGKFLVLIDSLNDGPEALTRGYLQSFLASHPDILVLMASQTEVVTQVGTRTYALQAVNNIAAKRYLQMVVGADVWDQLSAATQALATNPQDLELLAETIDKANPSAAPYQRASLYRKFLQMDSALAKWVAIDSPQLHALFRVSFRIFELEPPIVPSGKMGGWVRHSLTVNGVIPDKMLVKDVVEAVERSRLFRTIGQPDGLPLMTFRHELIGKYLAARHMLQLIERGPGAAGGLATLVPLASNRRWQDAFRFVIEDADQRHDLNGLLRAMMDGRRKLDRAVIDPLISTALASKGDLIDRGIHDRFVADRIEEERLDLPMS